MGSHRSDSRGGFRTRAPAPWPFFSPRLVLSRGECTRSAKETRSEGKILSREYIGLYLYALLCVLFNTPIPILRVIVEEMSSWVDLGKDLVMEFVLPRN